MGREAKKYEELTITDDFMFGKVMQDPRRCKRLLEIILGVKIRKVVFLDEQEALDPDYDAKGIRLDIYVEDEAGTVYAVEMQVRDTGELPERSRYYHSVIDINMIGKGAEYAALRKSYVIFICTFDLFGKGRHIYHFENLCREDPTIRLNDGTETIFLNTKGILDDADADLRNLLKYFESQIPQDEYTKELDDAVGKAKLHREWRREYMKREVLEWINRSEGWNEGWNEGREAGREDGRVAGLAEGRAEGLAEGEMIKLINIVCRMVAKNKTPLEIAEELGEEPEEIKRICNAAVKYAPNYNADDIFAELQKSKTCKNN